MYIVVCHLEHQRFPLSLCDSSASLATLCLCSSTLLLPHPNQLNHPCFTSVAASRTTWAPRSADERVSRWMFSVESRTRLRPARADPFADSYLDSRSSPILLPRTSTSRRSFSAVDLRPASLSCPFRLWFDLTCQGMSYHKLLVILLGSLFCFCGSFFGVIDRISRPTLQVLFVRLRLRLDLTRYFLVLHEVVVRRSGSSSSQDNVKEGITTVLLSPPIWRVLSRRGGLSFHTSFLVERLNKSPYHWPEG